MDKRILITGASGLLGKVLVHQFVKKNFFVFAQYHKNPQGNNKNCEWIQADFSTLTGIRNFLIENSLKFKHCRYLINNYGPITYKNITDLTSDDFYFDFHHNLITSFEITDFFIKHTALQVAINIGFEDVGVVKPYKKILSYAAAKNVLFLVTKSFAAKYRDLRFHMVSLPTIDKAKIESEKGRKVSTQSVANEIYQLITGD